jgi:dTDP-4-amino-4,6-dideoxygalactose transaminase
MIPFIKIAKPNLDSFLVNFQKSVEANHYSNFGPNEQELTKLFEEKTGCPVVLSANATLALEGLHHILGDLCGIAYLPGFTFPATNLGCRVRFRFGETQTAGKLMGFSLHEPRGGTTDYAITTVPFGTEKPKEYCRPDTTFWVVDNAAGISPDLKKVKDWLAAGADVVVCSLHATKILSGCEGGVCFFNNRYLYEVYRKYVVFGFYLDEHGVKQTEKHGSNHKMSELSAAFALMFYRDVFPSDYSGRVSLMQGYEEFCLSSGLQYIASPQVFWIKCNTEAADIQKKLAERGIQTAPYYRPLWREDVVDAGSQMLSRCGLCLPSWNMSNEERLLVLDGLNLLT